jgi:hypothetical protein
MLPILEDGTSRLELFSSIRLGVKMRHMHTFGCPVFALQNELASGRSIPHWSPRARLGVNLDPSSSHARNVNLVLNLHTGCISPRFHCRFDDFFESVKHGGPDVSVPSAWQQLSGLVTATQAPSLEFQDESVNLLTQDSRMQAIPIPTGEPTREPTSDQVSFNTSFLEYNDGESISPEYEPLQISQDLLQDGTSSLPSLPSDAGTSSRGQMRKMSHAMAESISQKDFYGKGRMHYMAAQAITSHAYDQAHDEHLALQDRMRHLIAFPAEMMGDIMHLHQAFWQPDSCQFVDSVFKEINGHIDQKHWLVIPKEEVPEDTDIIPSIWAL